MIDELGSFCSSFCMCIVVTLPSSKRRQFEKELEKKEYHDQYKSELEKTNLKVTGIIRLGVPHSEGKERGFIINLEPDNTLSDKDFFKIFPIFQKRAEALEKKYSLKDFGVKTCTDFSFRSDMFKPLGELNLPANMILRNEILERVGEPELRGFKIAFKKSPIGMQNVYIELSNGMLTVRTISTCGFTQIESIIKNTFVHAKQLANLFVEEIAK